MSASDETIVDPKSTEKTETTTETSQPGGASAIIASIPTAGASSAVTVTGDRLPPGDLVSIPPEMADKPRRKIGLVGYTTSRQNAPYDDPEWELWGMNNLHLMPDVAQHLARFARWYNLHDLDKIVNQPREEGGDPDHLAWLRSWKGCPVYLMDPAEGLTMFDGQPIQTLAERTGMPAAVPFPKTAVLQHFPRYFTNTVSWQIAHAILEAMTDESYILSDLGLWGIDMAVGSEYAAQRPSVEYFLGLAAGLGVEVHLPDTSDLLKSAELYGGEDQNAGMRAKIDQRLKELRAQKDAFENQIQQLQFQHAACCGAIDSFSYIGGVWMAPAAGMDGRDKVLAPEGAASPVALALAEADARDRHSK